MFWNEKLWLRPTHLTSISGSILSVQIVYSYLTSSVVFFLRIMNFPSHAEPIVSWLVLTLIRKFLGNFWDRFTGKLIQSSIREFQGVWQAVLLEDSSRPNVICHISLMVSVKKFEWMSFPVKRPVWRVTDDPENENFRKISGWVFYDLPIRVIHH